MIYTVGGIKGGTGKTTVAVNLTVFLVKKGYSVLLVDADEQETATDFTTWRETTLNGDIGYTATKLTGESIRSQTLRFATKYDHIVIDTGARDTTSQRASIMCSDIYLLPFQPRGFDVWTVTKVAHLIREIMVVKPTKLLTYAFLNRSDVHSAHNTESAEVLNDYPEITFLDKHMVNRKAFANAGVQGLSVLELVPQDEKAIAELLALFASIPTIPKKELI